MADEKEKKLEKGPEPKPWVPEVENELSDDDIKKISGGADKTKDEESIRNA